MKKLLLSSGIVGALVFQPGIAQFATAQSTQTKPANEQVMEQKSLDEFKAKITDKVVKEAAQALDEIKRGRQALDAKDQAAATRHLQSALGKIEAAIAIDPAVEFVPLEREYITLDAIKTEQEALFAKRTVEGFLRRGRVQDARLLMKDLASELDVRTTALPLVAYADAIKLALPLVVNKDYAGAAKIIDTALNTIVTTDKILPLPIIRMAAAIEAAQKVEADNASLNSEQKTLVLADLDYADEQMRLAVALGYADKDAYKATRKLIKLMKKNVVAKKSNTKNYVNALKGVKKTNADLKSAQERADAKKESTK